MHQVVNSNPASIVGIDPGKHGYFALLSACGTKHRFWPMPLVGDKIVASAIAGVYHEIKALCKQSPRVFIERIFTRPTDACSQAAYDEAREYLHRTQHALDNGQPINQPPQLPEVRMDGRVGNLKYAHGAALLEMCALFDWPITTVSPATWMNAMYRGLPGDLTSKDRARFYIQQKWPDLMRKGSPIWPDRARKAHDGACDALCLAEYGRRTTYGIG